MARARLSRAAEHALQDIYVYTHDRYGEQQAEAYHEAFKRIFDLLVE